MLTLNIFSPERKLLESKKVDEVTLPGSEGQIQILSGHAAMIGTLETGVFSYQPGEAGTSTGVISTGFFEVNNDQVSVMAETVELKNEIDQDRAHRAQIQAEEALKDANLDEHKFRKYQLKLQRALIRQQVSGKNH